MKCFCSYVTENFSSIYKIVRDAELLRVHLEPMTQKYYTVFIVTVIIIFFVFSYRMIYLPFLKLLKNAKIRLDRCED